MLCFGLSPRLAGHKVPPSINILAQIVVILVVSVPKKGLKRYLTLLSCSPTTSIKPCYDMQDLLWFYRNDLCQRAHITCLVCVCLICN